MNGTPASGRLETTGSSSTELHQEVGPASRAGTGQPALIRARGLVARRPTASFLVLTYVIGWATQLGAFQLGLPALPSLWAGAVLGLLMPAVLVTAAVSGKAGVRDLLRRSLRWRVGAGWYLLAVLGLLTTSVLVASPFLDAAPLTALVQKWPLFLTTFLPELLMAFVLIQVFEETAWTGFLQDSLQNRHGPLLASILVAPAFSGWHLMANVLEAGQISIEPFAKLAAQIVMSIFFRIVITWLYNGAGRSVLIAALFHSAFNSATGSGDMHYTNELISGPLSQLIPVATLALAAIVLVVTTRGRLGYQHALVSNRVTERNPAKVSQWQH
jgi:uncharacterized protein